MIELKYFSKLCVEYYDNEYLALLLVGFFCGCFLALLVATILRITSQQFIKKKKGTFYMENIFPLYR